MRHRIKFVVLAIGTPLLHKIRENSCYFLPPNVLSIVQADVYLPESMGTAPSCPTVPQQPEDSPTNQLATVSQRAYYSHNSRNCSPKKNLGLRMPPNRFKCDFSSKAAELTIVGELTDCESVYVDRTDFTRTGPVRVTMTKESREHGTTALSRMNFSGHIGHMYLVECLLLRAVK